MPTPVRLTLDRAGLCLEVAVRVELGSLSPEERLEVFKVAWRLQELAAGGVERLDNGGCPQCSEPLDPFRACKRCKRRQAWLKGQRARIGVGSSP